MKSLLVSSGLVALGTASNPVFQALSDAQEFKGWLECQACYAGVSYADEWLTDEKSIAPILHMMEAFCGKFLDESTCIGYAKLRHTIIPALVDYNLKPEYFCEKVTKTCDTNYYKEIDQADYVARVLADKPASIQNDDFIDQEYASMAANPKDRKTFTALHLADVHMDLDYVVGSNWNCDKVICCRDNDGKVVDPKFAARPTGEYTCDLPYATLQKMGEFINTEVKPDVVFWTGDITPHDQWQQTLAETERYSGNFTAWMKEHLGQYALFPIEGNHDWEVSNSQNFSRQDPMIPFNMKNWHQWLTPEALAEYEKAGYYSEYFKLTDGTTFDKVRIIAMNTQPCYKWNFYLFETHKDGGDELAWFENLMKEMEAKGEIGILIGHIPTGNDCLYQWAARFNGLLERYQHIIRTQLYGHVHDEMFSTSRAVHSDKPISNQWWSGSGTPFIGRNPSFRTVEIDQETMLPVNMHTYVFNLTDPTPEWTLHHDQLAYYDIKDLSPSSTLGLAEKFRDDEHHSLVYINTKGQREMGHYASSCDETCRKEIYCQTSHAIYWDEKDCRGLKRIDFANDALMSFMETVSGTWYDVNLPSESKYIFAKK